MLAFLLSSCFAFSTALAATEDLAVLSLDELLEVDVVSAAKVPEKVTKTPAAIYIISQEDLRRSGVNNIPDALRMVPGLHVTQIDANKWAVSARGFSSRFSNKMLVMVDGRTVYSPLFSGVFWDAQDLMLEDIERIEIIRGPGGSLWGANAVNGVINILTKDSADSQGALLKAELGTYETGTVSARYGGWLTDRVSYRVYGKFSNRGEYPSVYNGDVNDEWQQGRVGFRSDLNLSGNNKVTLQGDIYDGESGQSIQYIGPTPPYFNLDEVDAPISGGNLLGRWTKTFSSDSEMILQMYYDRTEREEFLVNETLDTADIDFQHRITLGKAFEFLWGAGYRYTNDDSTGRETIPGVFTYQLDPQQREDNLFSAFVQGRIPFFDEQGELTLGTKVEHNDYTGVEWQPSVRALWSFNEQHSIWGAVSRSVRTPSRLEHDADINAGGFISGAGTDALVTYIKLQADDETDAEKVWSYELGYRVRPVTDLFFDATLFYNDYDGLINGVPSGTPFISSTNGFPYMTVPYQTANGADGETYGFELSASWSVQPWWRITAGYTWFQFNLLNEGLSEEARSGFDEEENTEHMVSLVSYIDLPGNFELNCTLYYVGPRPELGHGSNEGFDEFVRFDFNVGYHPTDNLTLTVGGRNLFENGVENADTMDGIVASEIPRIIYTSLSYTYSIF